MNKIIKAVKSLSQQQIDKLRILLNTKPSKDGNQEIISTILSFTGLDLILSHLKSDELKILNAVYWAKDGVTFGEIEKIEDINPERIEGIAKGLSSKLLVYVLKNRQKLHNRLDKIFIIPEFRDFLNPLKEAAIPGYYQNIKTKLENRNIPESDYLKTIMSNNAAQKLVRFLFKSGGIATLSESHKIIPKRVLEKTLIELKEKKLINVYHDLSGSFKTYVVLDEDIFVSKSMYDSARSDLDENINVNNQYMLLLNLLAEYDAVSTYGLFLTRQKEFRKIDYLRLAASMHKIFDIEGGELKPEEMVQLCLFILYTLKCVSVKRDSISISFKNIKDDIDDPCILLLNIINSLQNTHVEDKLFSPPFAVPLHKDIVSIVKTISKVRESPYSYLRITRILKPLSELKNREYKNISELRRDIKNRFNVGMKFLCIIGVIEIHNGKVRLSDIGKNIAPKLLKTKTAKNNTHESSGDEGKIYINPDFTLMIPKREMPSEAIYHLLTHTEIIKDDIILNARVSKNSILSAHKRGMSTKNFFMTLEKYSKSGLPQNLEFIINEWANQTVRLKIDEAVLLHTSHPSFIDELLYGELKAGILTRISPLYAVIDRKYLDRIVKMARKNDAVINLFEEEG